MKVYKDEIDAFEEYKSTKPWELIAISKEQYAAVIDQGRSLLAWTKNHVLLHNFLNGALLLAILLTDIGVLAFVNKFYSVAPVLSILLGVLVHGFITYSIIIFTIHEGASHDRIIITNGKISGFFAKMANNFSRLYGADPEHYTENHILHHKYFGTEKDGTFLNHIMPERFFKSLIPIISFFSFNDFKVHIGDEFTRSKMLTIFVTGLFYSFLIFFVLKSLPLVAIAALLVPATWLSRVLDRLRESYEHNLMPDDNRLASRSMGLSFWGIVIGGGPWGQPCHYMHHIFPSLPWYGQIAMHYRVKELYSEEQREEIFVNSFWGVPKKFVSLLCINRINLKNIRGTGRTAPLVEVDVIKV
jgi:fatty acid desaturase